MGQLIEALLSSSGWAALALLFLLPALEAPAFLGLVLPGELALLLGGVLASPGRVPRGAARAYRRLGRSWIRIDLADRLASHARKVRSAGGEDPVDQELATSIGLDEDAISRLMNEVGFTRAGEAWKWRGRRGPRPDHRAAGSYAFAELAKLKKK